MHQFVHHHNLGDLCQLSKFNFYQRTENKKQFSHEDGGVKDDFMKEEKLNEYLSNKNKQQLRQVSMQQHNYGGLLGGHVLQINHENNFKMDVQPAK